MSSKIDYSELFGKLITNENVLDDTKASFLYYLFPSGMFIQALSLLESSQVFIYYYDNRVNKEKDIDTNMLINELYLDDNNEENGIMFKTLVQSEDNTSTILVDIDHWLCSCEEFCSQFNDVNNNKNNQEKNIKDIVLFETDDIERFSNDKFAQLDANSFSKQRYFKHSEVICPHLLAYSILLRSSPHTLRYFTTHRSTVLMLPANNMDEWLRLHVNII